MNIRVRSLLLLALAQVTFGTAAIFVRYALTGTGAINASFLRLAIAAPIVLGLAYARRSDLNFSAKARRSLMIAGFLLGLHFATWIISLQYTSVVVATLLVCTAPFWLAVYDGVALRRFPPFATILAFAVASVATVIVVRYGPATANTAGNPVLGAVLALIAAVLISVYLAIMRSAREGHSTLAMIAYAYPSALIVLAPIALIAHEPIPTTWTSWGGIIGMAVVTQLIGHTALAASLRTFKPSTVAFAGLAEPPVAAVAAALLLNEPLTATAVLGGAVLLLAIAVVLNQDRGTHVDELTALESPAL